MNTASAPLVDIFWEGWPNWIIAYTSIATFLGAGVAAYFAYRAAHWTKQQAISSDAQAKTAVEQLAIAQRAIDANDARAIEQRNDLARAERRQAESRLDALAPVIKVEARRGGILIQATPTTAHSLRSSPLVLETGTDETFAIDAGIRLTNVSDHLAVISVTGLRPGDEIRSLNQGLLLEPGETTSLDFSRRIHSSNLRSEDGIHNPDHWLMKLEISVQDLGRNIRDTLITQLEFRYFELDGSRLLVHTTSNSSSPNPAYGELVPPRVYQRLDAEPTSAAP